MTLARALTASPLGARYRALSRRGDGVSRALVAQIEGTSTTALLTTKLSRALLAQVQGHAATSLLTPVTVRPLSTAVLGVSTTSAPLAASCVTFVLR